MTELPPPPEDELDDPWHDQIVEVRDDYGSPDVLAVVAIVVATASLCGFGLLNGAHYFFQYATEQHKTQVVLADVLGAAFALVPVWLGWTAAARTLADDPRWVGTVARAAVILGMLALVLRLVLAVLASFAEDPSARF